LNRVKERDAIEDESRIKRAKGKETEANKYLDLRSDLFCTLHFFNISFLRVPSNNAPQSPKKLDQSGTIEGKISEQVKTLS
jgi:hypothetical protein